jgi:hypothetical protein
VVKYKVDGVRLAWMEEDGRKMFKVEYTRPYGHKWFMHLHARDELEAYTQAATKLGAE